MIRKPYVAGRFYSGDRAGLIEEIEGCFLSKIGPGRLPEASNLGNSDSFKGGVSPHAGYVYSGHEAAHLYLKMFESGLPESVVILGPCHSAFTRSKIAVFTDEAFETPLGVCKTDMELAAEIAKYQPFSEGNEAHVPEHSIEVQVPFLQYIYEKAGKLNELKIAPLCVADQRHKTSVEAARVLSDVIKKSGKNVAVIASSDFSHYVPADFARKVDKLAIDQIINLNIEKMYEEIEDNDISMCGYGPISIAAMTLKTLYEIKPDLLKYGTSGDVASMVEVVAYAAISFSSK